MKYLAFTVALCLLLSGCASTQPDTASDLQSTVPAQLTDTLENGSPSPAPEDLCIRFCPILVKYLPQGASQAQGYSFFDDAAEATLVEILTKADYNQGLCRCAAEFTMILEGVGEYQLNLSQGYIRHEGTQADLTQDQVQTLTDILTRWVKEGILPEDFPVRTPHA